MKKIALITFASLIVLISIPVAKYAVDEVLNSRNYVTSRYSKYCYRNGMEGATMKDKEYYADPADCGKEIRESQATLKAKAPRAK